MRFQNLSEFSLFISTDFFYNVICRDHTEVKKSESVDPPGITVDTSNPPPSLGTNLEPQSNMLVGVITSTPLITFTTNDSPTLTAIGINPNVPPPNTQLAPPPTLIQSQIGIVSQSEVTVSTNGNFDRDCMG